LTFCQKFEDESDYFALQKVRIEQVEPYEDNGRSSERCMQLGAFEMFDNLRDDDDLTDADERRSCGTASYVHREAQSWGRCQRMEKSRPHISDPADENDPSGRYLIYRPPWDDISGAFGWRFLAHLGPRGAG
jgi:hypothetical protein